MKGLVNASLMGACLISITASGALAQDCKPKHATVETIEKGYVTVAVASYPPFSFVGTDGTLQGIDGQVVNEVAKMECLEVKAIPVDPAAAIQSVISKRADVTTGGWYRTAARAEQVEESYPLYVDRTAVISKNGYSSLDEMKNAVVGTVQGNLFVAELQSIFGDKLKLYPNPVAWQQDLVAGRIDAAFDGISGAELAVKSCKLAGFKVVALAADERVRASLEPAQIAIPMTKGNKSLATAFDEDIQEMQTSGRVGQILESFGIRGSLSVTGEPRLLK